MALHLVKRFGPMTALVRDGHWARRTEVPVGDLGDATLGVVGYGRIGQRTAELGAAFGMRILAYDPVTEPPADVRCPDLGDLAGRSDVISLHLPLYSHPDVVLTPHLMGLSRRATAATFTAAAQGVLDVLAGREPRAVADPAWLTHRHQIDHVLEGKN
jgi:phosphoglycerate dehydrogenase-like enzyme